MRYFIKLALPASILLVFYSCDVNRAKMQDQPQSDYKTETTDSVRSSEVPPRQFIRTADLKFRVPDVARSTYELEKVVREQGGFVIHTNLESNVDRLDEAQISKDSMLERKYYTVSNAITLRIPNSRLDTTLTQLAAMVDYLDHRTVDADDASLRILANDLAQKRMRESIGRNTTNSNPKLKNQKEVGLADENILDRQFSSDEAKISNLDLKDKVAFSTVSLYIYQRQQMSAAVLPIFKDLPAYKPGFFSRLWVSIQSGWETLEDIVLALVKGWSLILLLLLAWFVWKRFPQVKRV